MKILLLDLGRIMRGGQWQIFYLARHLTQTPGCTPLVAIPKSAPLVSLLEKTDLPFVELPSSSDYNPLTTFKLWRIIRSFQPDVVHTGDAKGASLAAVAHKTYGSFKLVHSRRVSFRLKPGWSKKKYLQGEAVVAASREVANVLTSCGVPAETTSTIHSGIDAAMYPSESRKHPVLTIGAVGTLNEQKGFGVLIKALAHLKDNPAMPAWQCMIAGDGPLRQELKQQAEKLNLARSILFLGYRDSREVLPEMDILTIPSIDGEGSNTVIKEGWATKTPIIASDLPSNLELVTHEHDGLVFANRNAEELATAIVRACTDPQLAQTLTENGSESVMRYTDRLMAEQYLTLYRRLLEQTE